MTTKEFIQETELEAQKARIKSIACAKAEERSMAAKKHKKLSALAKNLRSLWDPKNGIETR